ncbi:39S ribosomal protein L14, mitochondrial [Halotydeus destructor]|nr:39S ribosomal protein L14, mitochondrial [Halotydeus destructor]
MNGVSFLRRCLSTSPSCGQIYLLTRMRVVDNSAIGKQAMLEGKPPKVIHWYARRKAGLIGDKVMVAIKGLKKKGYIVGVTQRQAAMKPRTDSNNLVLVDDTGNPLGTRVLAPIPHHLRRVPEMAKIIAISSKFV